MLNYILLQADNGQSGLIPQLILFGAIGLIFYFFMIRPQQKRQKAQREFLGSIKKGEMVVTIGGMHGRIISIEDDSVVLEVDRGARIKFDKTSISLEASKRYAKS